MLRCFNVKSISRSRSLEGYSASTWPNGNSLDLPTTVILTVASDPQCVPRMLQEAEARTMVQGTDPAFVTTKVRLCIHCQ